MILCLSGWKGSGKDSIAEYLIKKHKAIRIALADPLKDSVAAEFGIDRSSLDDPKRKELPLMNMPVAPQDKFSKMIAEFLIKEFRTSGGLQAKKFEYYHDQFVGDTDSSYGLCQLYWTPRALAILKGSANRSTRSDFWTNRAFEQIKGTLGNKLTDLVVVTDLRYRSEASQFKDEFGEEVVTIRINRFETSPSSDPSERDLDDYKFDYYIDNTGTLENSHAQLEEILNKSLYIYKVK